MHGSEIRSVEDRVDGVAGAVAAAETSLSPVSRFWCVFDQCILVCMCVCVHEFVYVHRCLLGVA